MALGLALGSCQDSKLDPLSGDFLPAPTVVTFTKLDKSEAAKDADGRWIFNIDLSDDAGTKLHAVLVGNKYFLGANTYTEAPDATAKNGNFISGKTTVNGKGVRQGSITVREARPDYKISAVLFLEDGTPYKIEWTGKLEYEEPAVLEPEYTYTDAVAQDCTLEDGQTPVTDVESHTLTLKDKSGEFAAQIKLIRTVGTKDLSGTYTVKEYAHEDLSAGNGFDLGVYFGMPEGAYVIGSYYLSDGAVVIIEPGATISVAAMGDGVYSISGNGFDFLTAPEGFVPGGGTVYDMTDTVAQDCTLEDGQTPVETVESHTLVLKDDAGNPVAQIKLIRNVGTTDLAGDYTVKEYAHEDFSAGNGFDLGVYFGMDPGAYVIGTYYFADGELVIVEPGQTISVSSIAENTYKFVGSTDWEFIGKLAGGTPGPGPDPGPGPEDNEVYSTTDEQSGAVDESFAPVEGVTTHMLTLKNSKGEEKAWFQLVLAEGSTAFEGEYVCKEYAHEDHTFGNGYDLSAWGMGVGGSRYIGADGSSVMINPGETLTVTKQADGSYEFAGSTGYKFKCTIDTTSGGGEDVPVLYLNEFETQNKKIEIYNPSDKEIDMTGWTLSKDETVWTIPAEHSKVPAKGYAVYTGKSDGTVDPTFGLSGTKGFIVVLTDKNGNIIDKVDNSSAREGGIVQIADGQSWGRKTDGASEFVLFDTPTIGAANGVSGGGSEDVVELTEFLSIADYSAYGMPFMGLELGTPGFYYTAPDYQTVWTPSYPVDGNYIKLELFAEGGIIKPGTYVPSAASGTVNEGEFNLGSDNGWGGFNGTTWYTVSGGTVTGVPVTDGTVTVSIDADVFTFEIKSSAVNAKYVGKLNAGSVSANITIDGNFDDWADVPSADPSDAFIAFKVHNDADNFYFYVESDPGSRLWSGGAYLYLYFNFKNDLTQGEYGGSTGMHDNKYDAYTFMYLFGGSADAPKIENNPNGGEAKGLTLDNIVIAGNQPATASDIVKMEIVIPRANFTTQVNAGDVIEVDAYRSKDGGNVYFPGYVVK